MKKHIDLSNEEILEKEAKGESLAGILQGNGRLMKPREEISQRISKKPEKVRLVARVNVDFPLELLQALDAVVERLGVNRQASIKEAVAEYVNHKIDSLEKQANFLATKP